VVRLSDGRVLAAGGSNKDNTLLANAGAAIFDGTRSWTPTGSMNHGRWSATAVRLNDGRVMVIGGQDTPTPEAINWYIFFGCEHYPGLLDDCMGQRSDAEIFDPATGTWTVTAAMSGPRFQSRALVLADGRVLVAGGVRWERVPGQSGYSSTIALTNLASAEIYDPATNTWTPAAPSDRAHVNPGYNGGFQLHLLGDGRVVAWDVPYWQGSGYVSGAEVFDPASNTWSALGGAPARFGDATAVMPDGRLLVTGGYTYTPSFDYDVTGRIFDPVTNDWSDAPPMPAPRDNDEAVNLADGRVLFYGGQEMGDIFSEEYQEWWFGPLGNGSTVIFDPSTGTWSAGPSIVGLSPWGHPWVPTSGSGLLNPGGDVYRILTPPVASGQDQSVNGTTGVIGLYPMNATGSSDPDGDALVDFSWRAGDTLLASGPSATSSVPLAIGTHVLTLTVTDITGQTSSDTVTIVVQDTAAAVWGDLQMCSASLSSSSATIAALQAEVARLEALVEDLSKDKKDKKGKDHKDDKKNKKR
jgi:hypothetical protein